jgi:hypothetical protein
VDLQSVDPNERFRLRRARTVRRRRWIRAGIAAAVTLAVAVAAVLVATGGSGRTSGARDAQDAKRSASKPETPTPRPLPYEIRGVHVTMSLASLPGRLDRFLGVTGLNAVELDVKDESGRVGFYSAAPALARATGAAGRYYDPEAVARNVHAHGVYLIGRVVTFEDPVVSERRPALAIRTRSGGVWRNRAGLGWANPYARGYWRYTVDVAEAAARAGFDEIQFDYVRFPTDGDTSQAVFRGRVGESQAVTISRFLRYARSRLRPLGVRVSADVFGLAATRDLGIGQAPGGSRATSMPSTRWSTRRTSTRGVPARRSECDARPDGRRRAARLQAEPEGPEGAARAVAAGFLAGTDVRPRGGAAADRRRAAGRRGRVHALERRGRLHARRPRRAVVRAPVPGGPGLPCLRQRHRACDRKRRLLPDRVGLGIARLPAGRADRADRS